MNFFIKHRQNLEKISLNDIVYLEADGRYTQIITRHKKYLIRRSLQEMMEQLESLNFFQTHRSFILNMDLVSSINLDDSTIFAAGFTVPLSQRSREAFLKNLEMI